MAGTSRAISVGCCGWSEARQRYFADFPVIELQGPFYEMPSPALAATWRAAAPDSFEYCLKAWQLITHTSASPTYRRLKSALSEADRGRCGSFRPTDQVRLAWERTRTVAQALRARIVLFQCPASFRPTAENIRNFRSFFSGANRGEHQLAWEPRGEWDPELIRGLCAEFDLLHCVDPFQARSVYGETVYWRLHGRGGYSYSYGDGELEALRDEARACIAAGRGPVYALFNNISAKDDALRFQAIAHGIGK